MDGIICPPSVQVRRIAFHNGSPSHFNGMEMKILPFDRMVEISQDRAGNLQNFLDDESNYSVVPYKSK